MDIRSDLIRERDFLAILFIRDANEMDAGQFTCKVIYDLLSFLEQSFFTFLPNFNENQYSIRETRLKMSDMTKLNQKNENFAFQVFDIGDGAASMVEEATVPEAQLNQFPSTEAHINVEVVLRPKIDVYPASATLVKQVFIHLSLLLL